MQNHPDKWRLERENSSRLFLKHDAQIDVAVEGSYWVDINDEDTLKNCGAPLTLGWWQHHRVRQAGKALMREKMMRILDRHELLQED
jgi:hypothetical protein